jgi:protease I
MADKRLAGTKVLMVIAPSEFRDEELLEPKQILEAEGAQVTVASTKAGEAKGMLGARVTADTTLDQVKATDFHGIVVVGGMGSPEHLWTSSQLHQLVQQMHREEKVVAAICLSGAVLAKAGVLQGRRGTVWEMPESHAAFDEGNATFVKEPVVEDGHLITAEGPEAATDFGKRIANKLAALVAKV